MSPVQDGPWHQSRRMGDVAAVLLSNDSSQEDLESAAHVDVFITFLFSGHLDYPFQSYGPKQVRLICTHPFFKMEK